tara:strand:+ start:164 stop:295 length:132 start_codon:yes stop_codon:yes gene_type:complete
VVPNHITEMNADVLVLFDENAEVVGGTFVPVSIITPYFVRGLL